MSRCVINKNYTLKNKKRKRKVKKEKKVTNAKLLYKRIARAYVSPSIRSNVTLQEIEVRT